MIDAVVADRAKDARERRRPKGDRQVHELRPARVDAVVSDLERAALGKNLDASQGVAASPDFLVPPRKLADEGNLSEETGERSNQAGKKSTSQIQNLQISMN